MTAGTVEAIHIAPEGGADMQSVEEIEAVAGKGLRGDRYFKGNGTWNDNPKARDIPRDITLFEAETLDVVAKKHDIHLDPGEHRRNVTTRGLALDHLLDKQFTIGDATFETVDLCEPCAYLESITEDGVLDALVHRGGLNAIIVDSGTFRIGDPVEVL